MASTFSESWYRVAHVRAALRPAVRVRKQTFQGEIWYVLEDPFTGAYFRMVPTWYEFVGQLRFDKNIEEIWRYCLDRNPEQAPGQQDVISILSELNRNNLIFFEDSADTARMFERQWEQEKKETRQKVLNFLFLRLPVGNPDPFLEAAMPLWRLLINKAGFLVWLVVVGMGLNAVFSNVDRFLAEAGNVLAPKNLILFYLCLAGLKIFHELGHAAICKRFGGHVNVWGVMLVLFTPLPFVDATSAWIMRSRWHRVLVGSAGMLVELFIGALAAMLWASSGAGMVHDLAYNVMFTASVSTLLFNANPLMRFDGYYILSDLIGIPNLQQQSKTVVNGWCKALFFGMKQERPSGLTRRESIVLPLYGVGAALYRLVLLGGIVIFIADSWLIPGIALGLVMGFVWLVLPVLKFWRDIHIGNAYQRNRARVLIVSYGLASLVLALVLALPLPRNLEAPLVVEAVDRHQVAAETAGQLVAVLATPNSHVQAGEPLVRLDNPDLSFELSRIQLQIAQNHILRQQARSRQTADLDALQQHLASLEKLQDKLEAQQQALVIRAPGDGIWQVRHINAYIGQWRAAGASYGAVVDSSRLRLTSLIRQEDIGGLLQVQHERGLDVEGIKVRLTHNPRQNLVPHTLNLLPHAREDLPHKALSTAGGGPFRLSDKATTAGDRDALKSAEPFYVLEIQADADGFAASRPVEGMTGNVSVNLGAAPAGQQVWTMLQQFLQKRYRL